jgi:uncharacterized membrane protein AbrB (regulator of aidB expression)
MLGHLVAAPDQVSRLVVLAAVCLLGSRLGRRLSLPAPVLLGSMLVATVAIATQAASGFAPAGPLRDAVFIVVGLEVGLRFTWPSIRQLGKAVPYFVPATVLNTYLLWTRRNRWTTSSSRSPRRYWPTWPTPPACTCCAC